MHRLPNFNEIESPSNQKSLFSQFFFFYLVYLASMLFFLVFFLSLLVSNLQLLILQILGRQFLVVYYIFSPRLLVHITDETMHLRTLFNV